ncbi:MAG: hypothetical protein ACK4UY_06085 [Dietzia sp.]
MILTGRVATGVAAGSITLAFRRWKKPRVATGHTFRSSAGVVTVGEVSVVAIRDITGRDAAAAGAASVEELVTTFRGDPEDPIFRIELTSAGPDPREQLGDDDHLTDGSCAEISRRLARFDQSSRHGTWTLRTLCLIEEHPGRPAEMLRGDVDGDMDKAAFKRNVRKLKDLGLTRSLPEGYELSPRGSAYLARRIHR